MTTIAPLRPSRKTQNGRSKSVARKSQTRSAFASALAVLLDGTSIHDRRQWAEFLEVTEPAISQWVCDRTLPSPERLRRILDRVRDEQAERGSLDGVEDDLSRALEAFEMVRHAPIQHVTPLAARMGDNTTVAEYLLQPLRTAWQRNLNTAPVAFQENFYLSTGPTIRHAALAQPLKPNADVLRRFRRTLEEARVRLGADSLCFYVADPLLEGDCRLALQDGVRYPEALEGPSFPLLSNALNPIQSYAFYKDARSAFMLRQEPFGDALQSILPTESPADRARSTLFGDFIDREGIVSCARIESVNGGRLRSVLFVNYSKEQHGSAELQETIGALFDRLNEEAFPYFWDQFNSEKWGEELHTLPIALQQFLARSKRSFVSALEGGLEEILRRIFDVLALDPRDTVGTVHIYERTTHGGILVPAAQVGPKQLTLPVLETKDGKGLITWAALRRRAIIVNDLGTSKFEPVYHEIRPGTRSEMALPLLAGDEVAAVLNIESTKPRVFDHHLIRTLALAGCQIGIMLQNFLYGKHIFTMKRLLSAIDGGLKETLEGIALLARNYVDCSRSDVWRFNEATGEFDEHGGDVIADGCRPRPDGWSAYLVKHRKPVFIQEILSLKDFSALEWDGTGWVPVEQGTPDELNAETLKRDHGGSKAQLGLPIAHGDKSFGVLWVKFDESTSLSHLPPTAVQMRAFDAGLLAPTSRIVTHPAGKLKLVAA